MGNHETAQHEATLFAEPIFNWGSFSVTNSLLNSFVATLILVIFFWLVARKVKSVPRGLQNFFELVLEFALSFFDSITNNRKKSEQFLPLVLGLFLFILVNNYLGLLPGIGTVGFVENHNGESVFVPLLRGATADLNTTLALGLISVIIVHMVGVWSVGWWAHLNKFLNFKTLLEIPRKFTKDPSVLLVNPIKFFVGIIEIVSELAKIASLSFRLFGNIFAGEVLLASMMTMMAFLLPIPFIFLEVLVGVIQALVFAVLILVFLTISTQAEEH